LLERAEKLSTDGFQANLQIIDRKGFGGIDPKQLGRSAAETNHAILFVADEITMKDPERSVLCIDVFVPERSFRIIPCQLWSAENNLSLANMDFVDFVDAADGDGIFRGF
jgi:hypothetical protein